MFGSNSEMKLKIWPQNLTVWRNVSDITSPYDFQRNRCTRNVELLGIREIQFSIESIWLNPKSSRFAGLFSSFLSILVLFTCSIDVNFACLLKLWPGNRNCWSAWSEFWLFTPFRWLFSFKLKVVSDLPAFCLLHNTHFVRYIRYLLLQLGLLYILKVLCVTVLVLVALVYSTSV